MNRPLHVIALDIRRHWPKVSPYAKPYLEAMQDLTYISDAYGADSGTSIVSYFLANAASFKGEDARRIKAELNLMLKEARR